MSAPPPSPPVACPPAPPAPRSSRWRRRTALALVAILALAGCGKKGPPLAPLTRLPGKVAKLDVHRAASDVYVAFTIPAANIAGDQPADLDRLEVYAVTATRPPVPKDGVVPDGLTLVATVRVQRPPPPGAAAPDPGTPPFPGLPQGSQATVHEALGPEAFRAVAPAAAMPAPADIVASDAPALSLPLGAVAEDLNLQRYYLASGLSRRGRRGPWSDVKGVPLAAPSGPPHGNPIAYDATGLALTWTPAPDAGVAPPPPDEGLLPSRPFGPPVPITKYNVYPAEAIEPTAGAEGTVVQPAPLNTAPLDAPHFEVGGVAFGRERCFVVRGVDTRAGAAIEGPASAPMCVTPVDTFPPPAPAALEAVGGAGVISLIWEGVDAADLQGYLVFRGEAPGEPATALTAAPIRESSFEDRTVTPGVRYVYVVVAVDSASPANRSAPSNRVEETARQ